MQFLITTETDDFFTLSFSDHLTSSINLVQKNLLVNNANNNRQGYIPEGMLVSNFEGALPKAELGHNIKEYKR